MTPVSNERVSELLKRFRAASAGDRAYEKPCTWDEAEALAELALSALCSQSPEPSSSEVRVRKGWKLVPEEPTEGMWDAFFRARDFDFQAQMREAKSLGKGWKGLPAVVWDAMLAAAPTITGGENEVVWCESCGEAEQAHRTQHAGLCDGCWRDQGQPT